MKHNSCFFLKTIRQLDNRKTRAHGVIDTVHERKHKERLTSIEVVIANTIRNAISKCLCSHQLQNYSTINLIKHL